MIWILQLTSSELKCLPCQSQNHCRAGQDKCQFIEWGSHIGSSTQTQMHLQYTLGEPSPQSVTQRTHHSRYYRGLSLPKVHHHQHLKLYFDDFVIAGFHVKQKPVIERDPYNANPLQDGEWRPNEIV